MEVELYQPKSIPDVRVLYDKGTPRVNHSTGITPQGNSVLLSSIGRTFYITDSASNAIYSSKNQKRVLQHAESKLNIKWNP